ncbi:CYTH and CHAD domain-containing protein [Dechloromonas sp. HYN0024]|uniref:CYTH and CHAD domain-containing protein n=1 Tax=Dechloromonas sp. HYN0024 TaxID=2231055 RepID=UPI000E43E505|nr:CYTH and CHAD domain-containing protein [Dechloromonas sp. HYN0024]AXS80713.1 CHAD domain-containing protein [Dechloromonas sp. HYN0024]
MSTEIELKLQLSPKAAKKLAEHPLLADIPAQKQHLLNTYFDTPSLELHARRVAVRFRKKGWIWLCTVKSAEPASGGLAMRSEWEAPATPGTFDFSHVDNADFRNFLERRTHQFEPIFTTDFRRQIWHVPFGESLIELAIDRGQIESRGRKTPICEIELELLSGRVDDIFGLTRQLQKNLDLFPAIASKAERGYNLFLDEPLRPFKSKPVPINDQQTPVEAFRSVALGCLEHFQRNEKGLLIGGEPEFIHQARVALRRLRSAIKLFAPVLPPEFVAAYGQTWQTLAGALGDTRNWDVFLDETLPPIAAAFPDNRDIKRLRKAGQRRATSARKSVTGLLAVSEYPRLLLEFTAAIYTLGDTLPIPIKAFARQQIANHAKKARRLAQRHAELSPAERHKMRIAFKKLRYTLEFFTPLLSERKVGPYLAALAQLQDELGLINDHVTAETLLAEALAGRPVGPIHGWISGRHALLVSELPESLNTWLAQHTP